MKAEDFLYRRDRRYFATIGEGLETWGAEELTDLGAEDVRPAYRGFHFKAEPRVVYRILYGARLFSRVLAPLMQFDCHSAKYLHRRAMAVPWEELFGLEQTFAVHAVTANSAIRHSRFAALTLKDAVADRFREQTGQRPNVDAREPDVAIHLYIHGNDAVISLDLAGGSLHRRGYRTDAVAAPMQETLAAAMICASGWSGERPLVDPFCGSGTLLCEAWMRACHIPAGYLRDSYAMQRLPDFDASWWREMKGEMDGRIAIPRSIAVSGSDIDGDAVKAARANLKRLPEGNRVSVERADFRDLTGWRDTVIVTNPPYGVRLGDPREAETLLKTFGDFLKQRCAGCDAYVFLGDDTLVKKFGLKPKWKKAMKNGGLDGRLCHYPLFEGLAKKRRGRQEDH